MRRLFKFVSPAHWGIWTENNETNVGGLRPDSRGADVNLQGRGRITIRVPRYLATQSGARIKLRGRSTQGPLALKDLGGTGLFETKIALDGPAKIRFSVND